jgi:hypothetical protein
MAIWEPPTVCGPSASYASAVDEGAALVTAAGANVKVVQQMLGHASAAMTLDIYAGLFADLDTVADQLDRDFAKLNADQMRTKRRSKPSNQAALPFQALPEQAAG